MKNGMLKKKHFDFLCLDFVYKMKFVWVCYLEEKEQLKKCSLLDNNHTDFKTDENLISNFALKPPNFMKFSL